VQSRSRAASLAQTSARIVLAGTLALALLTGIAPLNALSSAAAACSMPCCASVASGGACATGACDSKLSGHSKQAKPPVERARAASSHCSSMGAGGATALRNASAEDVETVEANLPAQHEHHQAAADRQPQNAGVLSGSLAQPCPPDCCAGASAFAQTRRSRETAALAYNARPRPPTIVSPLRHLSILPSIADAWRRGSSPRAPPPDFS
jgi:hypothetical protein